METGYPFKPFLEAAFPAFALNAGLCFIREYSARPGFGDDSWKYLNELRDMDISL